MRLTKKLFSIVALILVCFSVFGFAGCDTRASRGQFSIEGSVNTVTRLTRDNYEPNNNEEYDYLSEMEERKVEAMKGITKILYTSPDGVTESFESGEHYVRVDGKTTAWITGGDSILTKTEYDALNWFAKQQYKERYITAYEYFIAKGGVVNGFNISLEEGIHYFTFNYNGSTSERQSFTIDDPAREDSFQIS